ncbi:hypothetical protein AXF42_Ash017944 [Apostasia shenzhenica]|uniref:Uncharacterized protein n=1 Tax=Apostasia shenzhenica TaxID=1088818 RepID=A0A2I0AYC5_9ASPA|nr:hypothetical protein AXF42_Ash017944 [Apostasia shenzhenica]
MDIDELVELEHYSPKVEAVANFDPEDLQIWMNENDNSRWVDFDLLEQRRQLATLKHLEHKRRVERYFNRRVNPRDFTQGDLVLKWRLLAGSNLEVPKLEHNWEGPYIVHEIAGPNVYYLMTSKGIQLPKMWSGDDLKKFYP